MFTVAHQSRQNLRKHLVNSFTEAFSKSIQKKLYCKNGELKATYQGPFAFTGVKPFTAVGVGLPIKAPSDIHSVVEHTPSSCKALSAHCRSHQPYVMGWVVALCGFMEGKLVAAANCPQQVALHCCEQAASALMHVCHLQSTEASGLLHYLPANER